MGRPPKTNPNAQFGYDRFGTTHNQFNYSALVMLHKEAKMMRDAKYVAVAPRVPENSLSHHHHHHHHSKRRGRQQVPLFVRSDKNVLDFVESEKGVPRFKENVGKSNPFIILETSGTGEKHGRHFSNVIPAQRSKLRGKGTKLRKKKKIGRSRNRFNLKSAEKQAKNRRFPKENLKKPVERLLIGGAGAGEQWLGERGLGNFLTQKGKRRKEEPGPLSAGDLWSLNRSAKNFEEFRQPGRRRRKALQPKSWRPQRQHQRRRCCS